MRRLSILAAAAVLLVLQAPGQSSPDDRRVDPFVVDDVGGPLLDELEGLAHRRWALGRARSTFADAVGDARRYAALPRDGSVLDEAAAAARVGDCRTADAIAARVLEVPQPAAVARRGWDLRGRCAEQLGEHARAVDAFDEARALASGDDPVAPWRDLWTARAALVVDPARAVEAAQRARDALTTDVGTHEAAFLVERARLQLPSQRVDAIDALDALMARYPEQPDIDTHLLELAVAETAAERPEAAVRRLHRRILDKPWRPGMDALVRLRDAIAADHDVRLPSESVEARLERGAHIRYMRHWDIADEILQSALDDAPAGARSQGLRNRIRLEMARNDYDRAAFESALAHIAAIDAEGGVGVSSSDVLRWRVRSLSRLDREDEAYAAMADSVRRRPAAERHRRLYDYAWDYGMYDVAYAHADATWSTYEWRTFEGAFLAHLAGHYERSAELFETVIASSSSLTTRLRARYWLGRTLADAGDLAGAREAWERCIDARERHYYGQQAANRIAELDRAEAPPIVPDPSGEDGADGDGNVDDEAGDALPLVQLVPASRPARLHWTGIDGPAVASLETVETDDPTAFEPWDASRPRHGELRRFADTWGDLFPEAREALALFDVGAGEAARRRFRHVAIELRVLDVLFRRGRSVTTRNPISLDRRMWEHEIDNRGRDVRGWWGGPMGGERYPVPSGRAEREAFVERHAVIRDSRPALRDDLLGALRELGDAGLVRRMVHDAGDFWTRPMDDPDWRDQWLDAYPRAWGELVEPHARRYDLNPYLLWSLMIVESEMNPDSISHADAWGLLQVITRTGELIARGSETPGFGVHRLLTPSESIHYGMWYLDQLLTKFHGQEPLALIAYNAGPHQVQRWLEWRGDVLDMDEFIETVPYDGARRYPQTILGYLANYRALYGDGATLYLGNALDPTFEENIYY